MISQKNSFAELGFEPVSSVLRTFVYNQGKPLCYHRGDSIEVFLGYKQVHLLHSFFSVPLSQYSTNQKLFAFVKELPVQVLPTVVEIQGEAFTVQRAVRAIPWADQIICVKVFAPPRW